MVDVHFHPKKNSCYIRCDFDYENLYAFLKKFNYMQKKIHDGCECAKTFIYFQIYNCEKCIRDACYFLFRACAINMVLWVKDVIQRSDHKLYAYMI